MGLSPQFSCVCAAKDKSEPESPLPDARLLPAFSTLIDHTFSASEQLLALKSILLMLKPACEFNNRCEIEQYRDFSTVKWLTPVSSAENFTSR